MLPQRLTNILTILISLVWTANVVAGFIKPELRDPMINALFAVVVGSIYALGRRTGTTGTSGGTAADDVRQRLQDILTGHRPGPADTGNEPAPADDDHTGGERP